MDPLTLFGLASISAMLLCYVMETRAHWWVLGFAACCALSSVYGFLQGAWPFGVVELIWTVVALARWRQRFQREKGDPAGPPSHGSDAP